MTTPSNSVNNQTLSKWDGHSWVLNRPHECKQPQPKHQAENNSELEKLWQEKLAPRVAIKLFENLLENVTLLHGPINNNLCEAIINDINALITLTDDALKAGMCRERQLSQDFSVAHETVALLEKKLKETRGELINLEATLSGLEQNKILLEEKDNQNRALVAELQERKEREKEIRTGALVDLIPGVGFVRAIATGRPMNLIPFYSQIQGIVSEIDQTVEFCELQIEELNREKNALDVEMHSTNKRVKKDKNEITKNLEESSKMQAKIDLQEENIQQLARDLTVLRNINKSLKEIIGNYGFLKWDIERRVKFVEVLGDFNNDDSISMRLTIEKIQSEFISTFARSITNHRLAALTQ